MLDHKRSRRTNRLTPGHLFGEAGISGSGLPCRLATCPKIFSRSGMAKDFAKLLEAAADRNEHELVAHGLVFGKASDRVESRSGHWTRRGHR